MTANHPSKRPKLPQNAATDDLQQEIIDKFQELNSEVSASAKQDIGNASLASMDEKLTGPFPVITSASDSFGVTRGNTALSIPNSSLIYPVLAVRLNSSYLTEEIFIESLTVITTSAVEFAWFIIKNPTVTGTAFSFSAVADGMVDADTTRTSTTSVSGGTIKATGYGAGASGDYGLSMLRIAPIKLTKQSDTADIYCLAVQRVTGTAAETYFGSINLKA